MNKNKPTEIYIGYRGITFKVTGSWNPEKIVNGKRVEPYIGIGGKQASQMIRQYIKTEFPKIKANVKTDSFTTGSSIRVNVYDQKTGARVDDSIYRKVQAFASSLKAGKFNGMNDSYEYNEGTTTDKGMRMALYTQYINVYNGPSYDVIVKNIDKGKWKEQSKKELSIYY